MRGKKDGIIWSIILIITSASIFFVLQFHLYTDSFRNNIKGVLPFELSDWREFFIVIMSGIFTSSFVTLIMNCSDYKNEKRDALEYYYNLSSVFLQNFRNLDYLYIKEDLEIIRNYYLERSSNDMRKRMCGDKKLNYKAKLALEEWIWKNESKETRRLFRNKKRFYLSTRVEEIISQYDQQIESIVAQYIKLSELSFQELENAYGKIDFLFTNSLNRNGFIFKHLHDKQRKILYEIQFHSLNFKNHHNNDINIVLLDHVLKLQSLIFTLEDTKYGKAAYNQFCYEITCNLEFLLKLIYKDEHKENYPQREFYMRAEFIDF